MSKFKGTPGIWDIDVNGQTILSNAGYLVADIELIHGNDSDVSVMVTAPELLEVLQDLVSRCRIYVNTSDAQAAIAKALGETK